MYKFILFVISLFFVSCSYLPEQDVVKENLKTETADYTVYYSGEALPDNAFLFVPGGLVDPYAYACWIDALADQLPDMAIVLIKYPSNLAISNIGKVQKVKSSLDEIEKWIIGGHSLGGVVAATSVHDNPDDFDGLIMLASYSREATDLSNWNGSVLSLYASEDLLSTPGEVIGANDFLPPENTNELDSAFTDISNQTFYFEIAGGNHAGFGCYGKQDGDGTARISSSEQQSAMIEIMANYFQAVW